MESRYIQANGIRIHLIDFGGEGEPLLLMHGLTANAMSFAGLARAGLTDKLHVYALDLRGRGESDKPAAGYSMEDHAADLLGVMDALGLQSALIGGHSFGGLVTIYAAGKYQDRVKKLVIMDSGLMHPQVLDLIKPSLDRLGKAVPSWETYLAGIKASPYYHDGFWDEDLEAYYHADIETLDDGSVRSRCQPDAIREAATRGLGENWPSLMQHADQPAILIYAPEGVGAGNTQPVVPQDKALETASMMSQCSAVATTGNHITMLFGRHAPNTVHRIQAFLFT
ncbi:MAG: alpha/beta hydrolase [Chloroflexi bacterium]|nr:alpha/beta hydrolase [Chloroflexota bacterium]